MPELVIRGIAGDPGFKGITAPDVHVADAVIEIAGLRDGMVGGRPLLVLGLRLPDGQQVAVETSWRLFATAFWYFAAKFGEERPDLSGLAVETDLAGYGGVTRLEVLPDALVAQAFFECELCGRRREAVDFDGETPEEQQLAMLQWSVRHFKEEHPEWTPPAT